MIIKVKSEFAFALGTNFLRIPRFLYNNFQLGLFIFLLELTMLKTGIANYKCLQNIDFNILILTRDFVKSRLNNDKEEVTGTI